MSVITQRGDSGETDLMYGRRVSKTHLRVVANGAIDELNSVLGLVRWHSRQDQLTMLDARLSEVQTQLILIMGEVATLEEDRERYQNDGFQIVQCTAVETLTVMAKRLESGLKARFRDWAIPGSSGPLTAAFADQARTFCRRAERSLWAIPNARESLEQPTAYLNRLSDFLWIVARTLERAPEMLKQGHDGLKEP